MPSGRRFVQRCWPALKQHTQPGHNAGAGKLVNHKRKSFGREERRAVPNLKMEMRIRCVAAISELRKYVSTAYAIPCFDSDASGLKMRIKCVPAVSEIDEDVISSCGGGRHPWRHGSRYL